MASLRRLVFIDHPHLIFPAVSTALAVPALSPAPSFIPLAFLLTSVLVYTKVALPRPHGALHTFVLGTGTSIGAAIGHNAASFNALSSTTSSIFSVFVLSAISSTIALFTVSLDRYSTRMSTPWAKITFFPALWATVWQVLAHINPLGHLMSWAPVSGIDSYEWMRPIFGPWAANWVLAAFAVVGAEIAGSWFIGPNEEDDLHHEVEPQLIEHDLPAPAKIEDAPRAQGSRHTVALAVVLLLLAVPSYFVHPRPFPPYETSSTPFTVGCILPSDPKPGDHSTVLKRFIEETKKVQSLSDVLLWPEGALRFENTGQREDAFAQVAKVAQHTLVGITFEERVPSEGTGSRSNKWRNGLALVGLDGTVRLEYYKRNLVPFAESFPMAESRDDPTIYELGMERPKGTNKTDWVPTGPPFVRPVPITASICLDFASPAALNSLPSRPSLILAPARTWHTDVSMAMWEQARARAEEIGSTVLFCDGGAGGASGVAGNGIREVMQVGAGSWTRTVGFQYPFDERRTFYALGGDWAMAALAWALLGVGWGGEVAIEGPLRHVMWAMRDSAFVGLLWRFAFALRRFVSDRKRGGQGEGQPLLTA
ncbi:hypothetical protein OF83DRAFT_1049838 [Amylostereum chailletii]|nr:hypothetical protein OF83DRAFT_1049838 [Amylostereum chailletii]